MRLIKPTKAELDAINMREVSDKVLSQSNDKKYILMDAGKEHYRLLYWLGQQFEKILELGTFRGHSALAMAVGGAFVHSYDIENHKDTIVVPDNLVYGLIYDAHKLTTLNEYDLIFIDTFHDGTYERQVLEHLRTTKWKGVLVLDDIHLNDAMKAVWDEITEDKEDWTNIGHWSGTGVVYFE